MPRDPARVRESFLQARPALRIALLVILSTILGTIIGAITGEKTTFLFKEELHLSASALGTMGLLLGIPSYLQPFVGAWTDLFPLWGFHRRSYYLIGSLIGSLSILCLAFFTSYHYATVAALLLLGGAGGVLAGVVFNAVMVMVGNRTGTFGRLQSLSGLIPLIFSILGTSHLSGFVAQNWSYRATFLTAAALSLLALPMVFLIEDSRVLLARHAHETPEEHTERLARKQEERARTVATLRRAAKSRGLWVMVAYVFYLIITPGPNTLYYMTDGLHLSKQFIGDLGKWNSAGTLLGLGLFAWGYRRLPVISLVIGAWLMDCFSYPAMLLMHDAPTARWMSLASASVGVLYGLCLNTLAARACPPGIEGTVYGLVMAAIALAGNFSVKFGGWLYDFYGPLNKAHHYTLTHGWVWSLWFGFAFTLIAGVLIPFLPDWAKSRERLYTSQQTSTS
jgi:MFS family permease